MHALIDHARSFASREGAELSHLEAGQSPDTLFLSCSDSRVVPALITGARPGELFELRTAGGVVPRYSAVHATGEAATIEYAVEVLGVSDIVICGHSGCGAVTALVTGADLGAVPAVRGWLEREPTVSSAPRGSGATVPDIARAVQEHILIQLGTLRTYPCVSARLADGRLRLHAWFYEVHTGRVSTHRAGVEEFLPL
ncbi:carbonic anhydrase [Streptomyces sp. NPDC051776]|uniref:carbonic anhydrase n=1 Tax=Streptomyces sp. NPDC051776 TaxID=3155414 RepID=UPI00344A0FA3